MDKVRRFLIILLTIATGGLFLYSTYTKLFPTIQSFEYTIVEFTAIPLLYAKILARFFVGAEAGLGALLTLHFFGYKKWVIRAAIALVGFFSLFLIYLWIRAGNNVNCGCFGDAIWMTPSVSLIKNAILLVVLVFLNKAGRGFNYKWALITAPVLLVATVATLFAVVPVYEIYRLNLKPLYKDAQWTPSIDLAKGKHIVAFLSPSCLHCRKAAFKMHTMMEKNPTLPFYMIIGGVESDLTGFWKDAQAENIPHTRLNKDEFLRYTKGVFPQILWLNNSMVEESSNYPELDQKLIEKWMK